MKAIKPDELMIEWNTLPAGIFTELYMPVVSVNAILTMANTLNIHILSHLLQLADAHILRFPAAGITYIPIPQVQGVTFAGLLTVNLPAGIRNGEIFMANIRQITASEVLKEPSMTAVTFWRPSTVVSPNGAEL